MATFDLSMTGHIASAPARVWAHLLDQEAIRCWLDGVTSVVSNGDEFLVRMGDDGAFDDDGAGDWIRGEVVEMEPRERLVLRLEAPAANLVEARVEVKLSSDEVGTIYELNVVGVPSLFGSLMLPLLRLRTEVAMARAVRGFRSGIESRSARKDRPFDPPCPEREMARAEAARAAASAA